MIWRGSSSCVCTQDGSGTVAVGEAGRAEVPLVGVVVRRVRSQLGRQRRRRRRVADENGHDADWDGRAEGPRQGAPQGRRRQEERHAEEHQLGCR